MSLFKRKITESEAALVSLQGEFAALSELHESLKEELKSAQESAATYLSEFTRVDAESKELAEKVKGLETELAETSRDAATFDEQVAIKAASEVASMGHEPVEALEEDDAPLDVVKTFKGLKGSELVQFYNANKQEIARALKVGK